VPENIKPVSGFKLDKYLGKWYEIARLDHSFERGLTNVTAEYTLRDDGGINVLNRGYNAADSTWSSAEGRAYFVEEPDEGYLKVSFFRPFYGSYVIFELDEDYQYSFVCGPDKSYLWLLSRSKNIKDDLKNKFMKMTKSLGFATEELIFVQQD
jgi:apolipoprotein D and lipocalin family protein